MDKQSSAGRLDTRRPHPDARVIAAQAIASHRAVQNQRELTVALSLATMFAPVVFLEIGTYAGGTAWAFGNLPSVDLMICIDSGPEPDALDRLADIPAETHLIQGQSEDFSTLHRVRAILDHRGVDVLFIDGSHDYESVRTDWELYRPLVRPGGLVMFHNTQPHHDRPEVEVHRLWAQLEADYQTVEIVGEPGTWAGIGVVFG